MTETYSKDFKNTIKRRISLYVAYNLAFVWLKTTFININAEASRMPHSLEKQKAASHYSKIVPLVRVILLLSYSQILPLTSHLDKLGSYISHILKKNDISNKNSSEQKESCSCSHYVQHIIYYSNWILSSIFYSSKCRKVFLLLWQQKCLTHRALLFLHNTDCSGWSWITAGCQPEEKYIRTKMAFWKI